MHFRSDCGDSFRDVDARAVKSANPSLFLVQLCFVPHHDVHATLSALHAERSTQADWLVAIFFRQGFTNAAHKVLTTRSVSGFNLQNLHSDEQNVYG